MDRHEEYEKLRERCWGEYVYKTEPPKQSFDNVFLQAYNLGRKHAGEEAVKTPKYIVGDKVTVQKNNDVCVVTEVIKGIEHPYSLVSILKPGHKYERWSEDDLEPYVETRNGAQENAREGNKPQKHKVGERVMVNFINTKKVGYINEVLTNGNYDVDMGVNEICHNVNPSFIEPYTETSEVARESAMAIAEQNAEYVAVPDVRMQVATAAMQGLLSNCDWTGQRKVKELNNHEEVAKGALMFADALIAEVKKGGAQ